MKTEPDDYSWDQLVADKGTNWSGVRNHQAAANMKAMKKGDHVFFYRSVKDPAVMGIMKVAREAYPNPKEPDGPFVWVDVAPVEPLPEPVPLAAIKADTRLHDLALVRQSRLSVMPVGELHWQLICALGGKKTGRKKA
ncbi:EVE domain-containing protein [Marinivivus vitaminiproducens]|uniref:EVE domain-containing protein n=1 Tax=Marinivivus vitaminiproducens TaxID=3035935 RepID=UPI003F9F2536